MKRAFTLVEMIVVMVIVGAVVMLLFPAFNRIRAKSRNIRCMGNMRQVGMAMKRYELDNNEGWPHGRVSVHPEHPEWPDPTGSLASLFPAYVPKEDAFRCPATRDVVEMAPDKKDFLGCANFYVSPQGVATRPEDEGKQPPRPPSYFYEGLWTDPSNIPRDPPVERIVYGDECVHGVWKDSAGELHWLGQNNHEGGGNFLFVDKHIEWVAVEWRGEEGELGQGVPYVPNPHEVVVDTYREASLAEVADDNVFRADPSKSSRLDSDLAGMMWIKDSWKEF